jgi:exodeoxyribonuclease VIII
MWYKQLPLTQRKMNMNIIDYTTHNGPLPVNCAVINMPENVYHAHGSINKSKLDKANRSMAHLLLSEQKEPTRAMAIGTAIHAAILEPEKFDKKYKITDALVRTSADYKAAKKVYGGDYTLTEPEGERVLSMRSTVEKNEEALEILRAPGWCEISLFARCPVTGIRMRCRFDKLTESGIALDVKKTQDIDYDKFQRSVAAYRYHVQDAYYSHVYKSLTGKELEQFLFLCVEETDSNSNGLISLDDEAKAVGYRQFMANIEYMKNADVGLIPDGLIRKHQIMSLPMWALDETARAEYDV